MHYNKNTEKKQEPKSKTETVDNRNTRKAETTTVTSIVCLKFSH